MCLYLGILCSATDRNPATPLLTLKPTLFDVLAKRVPNVINPCEYPRLHYMYLTLLKAHCDT